MERYCTRCTWTARNGRKNSSGVLKQTHRVHHSATKSTRETNKHTTHEAQHPGQNKPAQHTKTQDETLRRRAPRCGFDAATYVHRIRSARQTRTTALPACPPRRHHTALRLSRSQMKRKEPLVLSVPVRHCVQKHVDSAVDVHACRSVAAVPRLLLPVQVLGGTDAPQRVFG